MKYSEAIQSAKSLIKEIQPYCKNVEIVGDIRRRSEEVKSIEILAVSREEEVFNLFGESVSGYQLIEDWVHSCGLNFSKNGPKYKQFFCNDGSKSPSGWINLYLTSTYQWGLHMAIRTGDQNYASWLVTPRRKGGAMPGTMCVKDGWLLCNKKKIITLTERNFYESIDMDWVRPEERKENVWRK
jgi:DNA polymerase/3'-5' exonuclease PolX